MQARRSLPVVMAAVALVAAGCGESSEQTATQAEPKQGNTTATATCRDARGDSKALDLTTTKLAGNASEMTATFTTTEPMPSKGTTLYSVTAWSQDGNTGYQFGVKYDDRQQVSHFVFDNVDMTQANLSSDVVAKGHTVQASFPMSTLKGLGTPFKWSADLNVAGNDVDTCPKPGGDMINPKRETFPG
jgi:hypothetical protein